MNARVFLSRSAPNLIFSAENAAIEEEGGENGESGGGGRGGRGGEGKYPETIMEENGRQRHGKNGIDGREDDGKMEEYRSCVCLTDFPFLKSSNKLVGGGGGGGGGGGRGGDVAL